MAYIWLIEGLYMAYRGVISLFQPNAYTLSYTEKTLQWINCHAEKALHQLAFDTVLALQYGILIRYVLS